MGILKIQFSEELKIKGLIYILYYTSFDSQNICGSCFGDCKLVSNFNDFTQDKQCLCDDEVLYEKSIRTTNERLFSITDYEEKLDVGRIFLHSYESINCTTEARTVWIKF
ncbi:hypothetical protein Glove_109g13 [Diversispora epigaea]|uniref:Uncharacterized protein n=1 Tax=Diversispora epigaea TaxID=1348612 RepID=A0A397J5V4_9GLOM|nr:hypothetical protein Glove_109g13 [Diversispora epigaea]